MYVCFLVAGRSSLLGGGFALGGKRMEWMTELAVSGCLMSSGYLG